MQLMFDFELRGPEEHNEKPTDGGHMMNIVTEIRTKAGIEDCEIVKWFSPTFNTKLKKN